MKESRERAEGGSVGKDSSKDNRGRKQKESWRRSRQGFRVINQIWCSEDRAFEREFPTKVRGLVDRDDDHIVLIVVGIANCSLTFDLEFSIFSLLTINFTSGDCASDNFGVGATNCSHFPFQWCGESFAFGAL